MTARTPWAMRYVVQKSRGGIVWMTPTMSDIPTQTDDHTDACTYAEQHSLRGESGEMFRVLDRVKGREVFTVTNA